MPECWVVIILGFIKIYKILLKKEGFIKILWVCTDGRGRGSLDFLSFEMESYCQLYLFAAHFYLFNIIIMGIYLY